MEYNPVLNEDLIGVLSLNLRSKFYTLQNNKIVNLLEVKYVETEISDPLRIFTYKPLKNTLSNRYIIEYSVFRVLRSLQKKIFFKLRGMGHRSYPGSNINLELFTNNLLMWIVKKEVYNRLLKIVYDRWRGRESFFKITLFEC